MLFCVHGNLSSLARIDQHAVPLVKKESNREINLKLNEFEAEWPLAIRFASADF